MSTIAAGTTATTALVNTGDTTGKLTFQTNGTTTAMTIDTSQNVGIGTASPGSKLEVSGTFSASGVATFSAGTASAPAITTSGDTNNGIYFPAADVTAITTAGSERMRVDASGNVGIGTSSLGAKLEVNGGIRFRGTESAATTYSGIGSIVGDNVSISTIGTERLRVDSSGNVGIGRTPTYILDVNSTARFNSTIGVGNAAPAASGAGISFPATQSASSDANTLDDYEEGTWTPADGSGASLTFTNTSGNCKYTKIGQMVVCSFRIVFPTTASGAAISISGLPFTSSATTSSIFGGYISFSTYGSAFSLLVGTNSTSINIYDLTGAVITNSSMSGKEFRGVIMYFV